MSSKFIAVVGLQWGDEGKGKIIDALRNEYKIGIRFQGGANAGHTVYRDNEKIVLHQLPTSILHPEKEALISCGCVLDLEELIKEKEDLSKKNISVDNRLFIDERTPLVFNFHKEEDILEEDKKKEGKIGTTGKGIGPAYRDLVSRKALKIGDLRDKDYAYRKFSELWEFASEIRGARYGRPMIPKDDIFEKTLDLFSKVREFLTDGILYIMEKERMGEPILFEGAQGALLDVALGTYPYVTSSHTVTASISLTTGVAPWKLNRIIGVFKCYSTRVGEGPFPTEEKGEIGVYLREKGQEFGATTGRPRRCGWLDLPLLKYSIRITGATELIITKIDVLKDLKKIKVCKAYEYNGKVIDYPPPLSQELEKVRPIYEEFEGFEPDENNENLRKFLEYIEKETGTKITYFSATNSEELRKVKLNT
ncbi:MAG: adenylosuccinate synthase [Candidatus Hydrothermales bacterium]